MLIFIRKKDAEDINSRIDKAVKSAKSAQTTMLIVCLVILVISAATYMMVKEEV